MTDTFGTASFTVLYDGQERQQQAQVAYMHIPGGGNVIDSAGALEEHLAVRILVPNAANYAAMRGYLGGSATLYYASEGTIGTCLLASLQRTQRTPDGQHFCNAEFVVVT